MLAMEQTLLAATVGRDHWGDLVARTFLQPGVAVLPVRIADQTNIAAEFMSNQPTTVPLTEMTKFDLSRVQPAVHVALNQAEWWSAELYEALDFEVIRSILQTVRSQLYLLVASITNMDHEAVIGLMTQSTISQIDEETLLQLTGQTEVVNAMAMLANSGVTGLVVTSRHFGLRALWRGEWLQAPLFASPGNRGDFSAEIVVASLLAALRRGEPFDFALAYTSAACALSEISAVFGWEDLQQFAHTATRRRGTSISAPSAAPKPYLKIAALAACLAMLLALAFLTEAFA